MIWYYDHSQVQYYIRMGMTQLGMQNTNKVIMGFSVGMILYCSGVMKFLIFRKYKRKGYKLYSQ